MQNLKEAIHMKHLGMLEKQIILHDGVYPAYCQCYSTTPEVVFLCLCHPPYTLDLAASAFQLIHPLKKHFRGKGAWYVHKALSPDLFFMGIKHVGDICLSCSWNYVDK